jgi:hypothetical protein
MCFTGFAHISFMIDRNPFKTIVSTLAGKNQPDAFAALGHLCSTARSRLSETPTQKEELIQT